MTLVCGRNFAFLAASLATDWMEQSCAPNSAAFCNIPVLPFVVTLHWHSTQKALMVPFILDKNPQTCKTQIFPFPELSPLAGCRNEKNRYTFLLPTLKVSFSSQTTSLFVCQGKVFSAVNKNVGSKAQVTANRKKSVSMHYHIPAKGAMTFYLPQLLLGVFIIYTLSCVLVAF